MVLEFIYFNINQGKEGVFNTDNDSQYFQRQIAVTKPKAIHFSTQSIENTIKGKTF
jgi:hypothetical protein